MKVTSVELHPDNSSDAINLSFRDPRSENPYNVKAIVGLDADEIVPRYYGGSGNSKFYNLNPNPKKIVIRISLNPDFAINESFSDLRDEVYKIIASSRTGLLQIQFKNGDTVVAVISGFVTKLEAPLFNKEPEVQITVECDPALLQSPERVSLDVEPLDPELTVIQDSLSTAPHGMIFEVNVLEANDTFIIRDPLDAAWEFGINLDSAGGFLEDDHLLFSSEYNNKYLYLVREDNPIYLADLINPNSMWPIIFPGQNVFELADHVKFEWVSIAHYSTYWGV